MELAKQFISSLDRLLAESPELCSQIDSAPNSARAAEILLQAARKGGISIDCGTATAYIERLAQASNRLNNEELDVVAAGRGGYIGIGIGLSKKLDKDKP